MSNSAHAPRSQGTRLIVGLGNPGERYARTRHNLGFEVVAKLARDRGVELRALECNALITEHAGVLLAAPQTFMNRSGYAVRCLVQRRNLQSHNLLIVYDDVALPFGRLRLRRGGSPGGHRGMESVVHSLQTESIPRLRLGVAPEDETRSDQDLVDYVLSPFSGEEEAALPEFVERAASACALWLEDGLERAMNRFNG